MPCPEWQIVYQCPWPNWHRAKGTDIYNVVLEHGKTKTGLKQQGQAAYEAQQEAHLWVRPGPFKPLEDHVEREAFSARAELAKESHLHLQHVLELEPHPRGVAEAQTLHPYGAVGLIEQAPSWAKRCWT